MLSCFWGRFCSEWCGDHCIKSKEPTPDNYSSSLFCGFSFSAFSLVLAGFVCMCDYHCLRNGLIMERTRERGGLVLLQCATVQPQALFKMLSSKAFSRSLTQQLLCFFLS